MMTRLHLSLNWEVPGFGWNRDLTVSRWLTSIQGSFSPSDLMMRGSEFVSIESGETLAEVSSEEFSDLMEASRRYQEATNLPPVFYLAWTRDRGFSWTTAKLPDQTPKRAFDVEGAVSPDGTVALLVYNTQNGQLFSPDEINGQ